MKFGRLVSLLVLAVGIVSLWTDVAWAQQQVPIYRVQPTQVTRDSVLKLAREAFGMSSPQMSETAVGFVVKEESKRLQVTKVSGSILFADDSKLWNPDYRPSLPAESDAIRLATEFLRKHNLLPPQADPDQTGLPAGAVTRRLANVQADNHVDVSYYFFVNPGFGPAPFPGNAPGALLQVAIGQGGEVIGFMRRWHDIEPIQQRPLLSATQARELLCWKLQAAPENCNQLPDPGLTYALLGDLDVQTFVYPLYLFLIEETGYGVPATDFPVFARIRTPTDETQVAQGTSLEFRAEVRSGFGSSPYSYAWRSTLDGELSQASTFRKVLSPGRHIISLTVADRNGTVDVQYITVAVGSSGESATAEGATAKAVSVNFNALVGLGVAVAVILGLIGRRGWSRRGLLLVWLAVGLILGEKASWGQIQPVAGNFFNDGGPDFTGTFSLTDQGLRLRDLKWQNFLIAREISIPFVDVELNVGGAAQRVRLKLDPKKAGAIQQGNVLQGQCPNDPAQRLYGKAYQVSYKGLPVDLKMQGWTAGSLDVELSYYFYRPRPTLPAAAPRGVNCTLGKRDHPYRIAPEFYFQAQYDLTQLPQPPPGQAAPKLEKVRFAYRLDFDVQGGQNEIPALVREFIDEFLPRFAANVFRIGVLVAASCAPPQLVAAGAASVNMKGRQAQILCPVAPGPTPGQVLNGNPTQNTYDNYHQAGNGMWIPLCSAPDTPCVHMHLRHLDLGPRASARGQGFQKWPPETLEHTFTVVEYRGKAGQPQEPDPATVDLPQAQLPVDLAQNQLTAGIKTISNPVLWYVVQSARPKETFFAYEPVDFLQISPGPTLLKIWVPLHWAGFSCNLKIVQPTSLPIPTC